MSEFQIKYFADRLRKLASELYGGNKNLSKELGEADQFLNRYTQDKPTEPKIGFLYNLLALPKIEAKHIIWLLTGESLESTFTVNEKSERPYDADILELKKEMRELKADMFDLQKENKEMRLLLSMLLKDNITLENKNLILSVLHAQADAQDENVALGKLH